MTLDEFFARNPRPALAFSGGVDSAYLLYAAQHAGADVRAYYVSSAFQPQFEREDAKRLADSLSVSLTVLSVDILSNRAVTANSSERCYYCKKAIFSAILAAAEADGYAPVLDGTNASDQVSDRPGMRALRELGVRSPLRECGLTKPEVRRLSREAGLFTWDKPAYACLATRIPTGTAITLENLERTERAERFLAGLGFTDFRVRLLGGSAKLQLPASQLGGLLEQRETVLQELKKDYSDVLLDLEVRGE